MSPRVLTFNITPQEFTARCNDVAHEIGHPVVGNEGTIEHSGVAVKYEYDGTSQVTLTVLKHPFFVSSDYVAGKITTWFQPQQG